VNDTKLRQWLTEHGFTGDDLNAVGTCGLTPFMRAARQGDADKVRALLERGALLETRNADGNNALWFACVGEHLDMIELLVKLGIDIDNQNDNGATCLMYASSTGKEAVVKALLAAGANPNLKSLDDFTALDVAATPGCLRLLRRAGSNRSV
jgi:thiosulfate/3-mercaptopyruvate sulfurtransferase